MLEQVGRALFFFSLPGDARQTQESKAYAIRVWLWINIRSSYKTGKPWRTIVRKEETTDCGKFDGSYPTLLSAAFVSEDATWIWLPLKPHLLCRAESHRRACSPAIQHRQTSTLKSGHLAIAMSWSLPRKLSRDLRVIVVIVIVVVVVNNDTFFQ